MKGNLPQAKDIPDVIILKAISGLSMIPQVYQSIGFIENPKGVRGGPVRHFEPHSAVGWDLHKLWSTIPPKVIDAKLKKLVNQGLVSGCPCGCRGDFKVTETGRALIEDTQNRTKAVRPIGWEPYGNERL